MPPKITGAQPHLPWEVRGQLICLYWHFFREMLSLHTHPESIRLCVEHSSLDHRTYFQTSKGHVTWIIWKVNRIHMHCGVVYESVHLLARGHVIRMYVGRDKKIGVDDLVVFFSLKTWYLCICSYIRWPIYRDGLCIFTIPIILLSFNPITHVLMGLQSSWWVGQVCVEGPVFSASRGLL